MKTKDLIEALLKYDPEQEVLLKARGIYCPEFNLNPQEFAFICNEYLTPMKWDKKLTKAVVIEL